jgi:hypothetical protein
MAKNMLHCETGFGVYRSAQLGHIPFFITRSVRWPDFRRRRSLKSLKSCDETVLFSLSHRGRSTSPFRARESVWSVSTALFFSRIFNV